MLLAAACAADSDLAGAEYMDEDLPPWTCDTDGTTGECGTTGDPPAPSCENTDECAGQVCAASFNGDIGRFECQLSCIGPLDDSRWCIDAAGCCDLDAVCERGYCIPPQDVGTSTTDDGGSSGSASDTDGGSSSDGGSSDGGSSDGGSSDGGSSGGSTETGGAT